MSCEIVMLSQHTHLHIHYFLIVTIANDYYDYGIVL